MGPNMFGASDPRGAQDLQSEQITVPLKPTIRTDNDE